MGRIWGLMQRQVRALVEQCAVQALVEPRAAAAALTAEPSIPSDTLHTAIGHTQDTLHRDRCSQGGTSLRKSPKKTKQNTLFEFVKCGGRTVFCIGF